MEMFNNIYRKGLNNIYIYIKLTKIVGVLSLIRVIGFKYILEEMVLSNS